MKTVLVTSGGTKVPIDEVRDITNMSKGTFGAKIAREFINLGLNGQLNFPWQVVYFGMKDGRHPLKMEVDFSEETDKSDRDQQVAVTDFYIWARRARLNIKSHVFRNYKEYACGLEKLVKVYKPVITVLAAAVSDYTTLDGPIQGKIHATHGFVINLTPAEKLISRVKEWHPEGKLVGFKLLVDSKKEELIAAAQKSIQDNHCDMIVANDLADIKSNQHQLTLVWPDGRTYCPGYANLAYVVAEKSVDLLWKGPKIEN